MPTQTPFIRYRDANRQCHYDSLRHLVKAPDFWHSAIASALETRAALGSQATPDLTRPLLNR